MKSFKLLGYINAEDKVEAQNMVNMQPLNYIEIQNIEREENEQVSIRLPKFTIQELRKEAQDKGFNNHIEHIRTIINKRKETNKPEAKK